MEMEKALQETHYMSLNVDSFKNSMRVHAHLKSHLRRGLVQISGSEHNPSFQIMATVGEYGILIFKIINPFEIFSELHGPWDGSTLSFPNQVCNGYIHSKDFFSDNLRDVSLCFMKRKDLENPEFVKTKVSYTDDVTKMSHFSALTSWPVPTDSLKLLPIDSKVVLSIKTCGILQKWLKEQKDKNVPQSVKISLNEMLSVMVFSMGNESKTVEFKPVSGNPETGLLFAEKQGDCGLVTNDSVVEISLDSLLHALHICRIPAICLPCFNFRGNDVLEVIGLPFKTTKPTCSELSVLLLKANPQVDFNQRSEGVELEETFNEEQKAVENLLSSQTDFDQRRPKTPSPTVFPPGETKSRFYLNELSDSEEESIPVKVKPVKKLEIPEKRKREPSKKAPKPKAAKLTLSFNPLI
nr:DNA polymerase processivity subunit [Macronycteris gammaherpesvirus 1]